MNAWHHKLIPLTVIYSRSIGDKEDMSDQWHHISVSRCDRLPSWSELNKVKNDFLGEDVEAYQVITKKSDHVNVHSYCMHLWAPVDGKRRVMNLQDITWEFAE